METATHHQLETHRMIQLLRGELYPVYRRKINPLGWVLSRGGHMGQVRRRLSVTLML